MHHRDQRSELISSEPRQHVVGAQLSLHTQCGLSQIHIPDQVPVHVIDLFEFVKVNINQSEDSRPLARIFDLGFQVAVQREAVVYLGQKIEF
jgi:hypothetical protein